MDEELTDTQISLLCDIGQANHFSASDDNEQEVAHLLQIGYVRLVGEHGKQTLQLTEKASTFLSARGATLNEA